MTPSQLEAELPGFLNSAEFKLHDSNWRVFLVLEVIRPWTKSWCQIFEKRLLGPACRRAASAPPQAASVSAPSARIRMQLMIRCRGRRRAGRRKGLFFFVREIGPHPRAQPREQNELLKLLLCLNPIRVVCYPKPKLENLESYACTASQTTARLWRHAATAGPQRAWCPANYNLINI